MTETVNPLRLSPEMLAFVASVSEWDKALIEQAVYLFGAEGRPFSMNTFRDLLPAMAHGVAGRVFLSMLNRKAPPITEIRKVRSTSPDTHHKEIGEYVLTEYGYAEAARRFHNTEAAA